MVLGLDECQCEGELHVLKVVTYFVTDEMKLEIMMWVIFYVNTLGRK
jgi:hypothetical protein